MNNRIVLNLPEGLPKGTSQQKGVRVVNGKPYFYRKNKIDSARNIFIYNLKPFAPEVPSDKPIKLSVWFFFDVKDKSKWGKWKTSRPDADGYLKEFQDAMVESGFFLDDNQIVDLRIRKSYAYQGQIVIDIEELGEKPI
jgi:Holliday junction resolvase RusA-like endonuclease